MEVKMVGKWLGMPLHIEWSGTPLWTGSIPAEAWESKCSKRPDMAEEPSGWCDRKCGGLEGRRLCLAEPHRGPYGWTSGNKGPCGVTGHRGGQGPDCTDLLGRGKEFAFYSKYQWMPVEDFRQKNDIIWIMMLKDHSNSYAEKMQKRNKNEIQEIS